MASLFSTQCSFALGFHLLCANFRLHLSASTYLANPFCRAQVWLLVTFSLMTYFHLICQISLLRLHNRLLSGNANIAWLSKTSLYSRSKRQKLLTFHGQHFSPVSVLGALTQAANLRSGVGTHPTLQCLLVFGGHPQGLYWLVHDSECKEYISLREKARDFSHYLGGTFSKARITEMKQMPEEMKKTLSKLQRPAHTPPSGGPISIPTPYRA